MENSKKEAIMVGERKTRRTPIFVTDPLKAIRGAMADFKVKSEAKRIESESAEKEEAKAIEKPKRFNLARRILRYYSPAATSRPPKVTMTDREIVLPKKMHPNETFDQFYSRRKECNRRRRQRESARRI